MATETSVFSTTPYQAHRMKRNVINSFFSKASVDRSEPLLQKVLRNMMDTFDRAKGPVQLKYAFKSYAIDIVSEFCFPEGSEKCKADDFSAVFHDGQENFARQLPIFRHFRVIGALVMSMPDFFIPYLPEDGKQAIGYIKVSGWHLWNTSDQQFLQEQVKLVLSNKDPKRSVLREILDSKMPAENRTQYMLEREAETFIGAGTATVSRALEETFFYILEDAQIAAQLTAELRAVDIDGDLVPLKKLEQLPYLTAVVLEALRAAPAIPSRLPRINPTSAMTYKEYTIPPGTIIGMSPWDILMDPRAFSNPDKFDPTRWMGEQKSKLQRFLVPFGKGSRNCVGQQLALAEMYMVIGNMFRKYDMTLFETTRAEIGIVADCFVPFPYKGSKGVRVTLQKASLKSE
jgi:cytochrome P450